MKKLWMILGIIALGFVTSVTGAVLGVVLLTSILFLAPVIVIPVMIMFVYLLNYVRKEAEKRGIGAMVFIPCACVPPFIVSICMLLWITTDPPVSTAMGYDNLARWILPASSARRFSSLSEYRSPSQTERKGMSATTPMNTTIFIDPTRGGMWSSRPTKRRMA